MSVKALHPRAPSGQEKVPWRRTLRKTDAIRFIERESLTSKIQATYVCPVWTQERRSKEQISQKSAYPERTDLELFLLFSAASRELAPMVMPPLLPYNLARRYQLRCLLKLPVSQKKCFLQFERSVGVSNSGSNKSRCPRRCFRVKALHIH